VASFSFKTFRGVCVIQFGIAGINALTLPGEIEPSLHDSDPKTAEHCDGWDNAMSAVGLLKRYFDGEHVDFSLLKLDLGSSSPFFRAVCEEVRGLQYGSVSTYGAVAAKIGKKGAARAVGRVMANNPIPVI